MLISSRDSQAKPSDPLALDSWVCVTTLLARQVVCNTRGIDPLKFARALELCRSLTCRNGPEGLKRMIGVWAAAGVALVVLPAFDWCQISSVSKWLAQGAHARAMIALSLRYRTDDQLYFSLLREGGAILAADQARGKAFDPDGFAREFLIPPEHDAQLAAIARLQGKEEMTQAITALADTLALPQAWWWGGCSMIA